MLIDSHTHLESFVRRGELAQTLARAAEAGVAEMITIGTSPDDWELYRGLAAERPGRIHFTVGLHPCAVDQAWEPAVAKLKAFWAGGVRPAALGECGLDRFHLPKAPEEAGRIFAWQEAAFAAQLALAREIGCPVVVHSRGAFRECVAQVDASGVDWRNVVFHCFTEGPAEMAELNARGGRGSFTGILTYKNADPVRGAALAQGLGRLMLETDAPYLAPAPHRGKPNEPAYLRHTAEAAAALFGISLVALAERATAATREFYRLKG